MTLLDPQSDRTLYTEALTTPPGFRFDCAVALTYSLGLDTLLAVPLHLLLYSDGRAQETLLNDRLRVLDGVRQTASNLTIFHQQGCILAPRGRRVLYSLLEDSVYKASAPRGGIFHPKIWLLRFSPQSDESAPGRGEDPPLIRLSVLSRNLTADRSWDVSLTVEGRCGADEVDGNEELVRLLRRLPQLSPELPEERATQVASLANDLARTAWELPDGIDELRLHAIGLDAGWLPPRSERLVVMSPFCTRGALDHLAKRSGSPRALISRPEEISRISQMSKDRRIPFEQLLVLGETAETDDDEDTSVRRGAHAGLHAKLYLCDEPGLTRLFVGSANATYSATAGGTNIEVLAELVGSRERLGSVEEFLGEDGLKALLDDFDPDDVDPPPPEGMRGKELLERACGMVADSDFRISCHLADDGDADRRSWRLGLRADVGIELPPGLRMTAWPITLPRRHGLDCGALLGGDEITFGPMAVSSITRFIAFEISLEKENPDTPPQAFVLRIPADDLPVQERDESVVRQVLSNRDGFLRYLLFLLGGSDGLGAMGGGRGGSPGIGGAGGFETLPLLERMTRAFCRDPSRLDSVRRLVEHLQKPGATKEDAELIPPEFLQLWATFESALPGGDRE